MQFSRINRTGRAKLLSTSALLLLIAITLYFSVQSYNQPRTQDCDRACLQEQLNNHEVRKLLYWESSGASSKSPLIRSAPSEVIDYVNLDNQLNGYSSIANSSVPDLMLTNISKALKSIPDPVMNIVKPKVFGIFPVSGLGTSGYTEVVRDQENNPVGGFILIDEHYLTMNANAWITLREAMPFLTNGPYSVKATIEGEDSNNNLHAIKYILLHELGHILSIGEDYHPDWQIEGSLDAKKYSFMRESWTGGFKNGSYSSWNDIHLKDRGKIIYYKEPLIQNEQILDYYRSLEKTDFPSLYAATHFSEDFAESFATYVHCKILGKPYKVDVWKASEKVFSIPCCWKTNRCRSKEHIFRKILSEGISSIKHLFVAGQKYPTLEMGSSWCNRNA